MWEYSEQLGCQIFEFFFYPAPWILELATYDGYAKTIHSEPKLCL